MENVACPGCGQEKFPAVAGSECYCSCGTAFRIAENGVPGAVPREVIAKRGRAPELYAGFSEDGSRNHDPFNGLYPRKAPVDAVGRSDSRNQAIATRSLPPGRYSL